MSEVKERIDALVKANDVVIVMGAGSIGQVAEKTKVLAIEMLANGA